MFKFCAHPISVPRVQGVVYCTRSLLEAENENVVTRSIYYINLVQQKKTPFRIAPPVLPLSDRDIETENPLNGKYLRYPPSPFMSGCFVATITREVGHLYVFAKKIVRRLLKKVTRSGMVQPLISPPLWPYKILFFKNQPWSSDLRWGVFQGDVILYGWVNQGDVCDIILFWILISVKDRNIGCEYGLWCCIHTKYWKLQLW